MTRLARGHRANYGSRHPIRTPTAITPDMMPDMMPDMPSAPSLRLTTTRLVLRPTVAEDVTRALEIRADPAVARNLVSATIQPDVQKMTDWFASHAAEWHAGTAYRFAILRGARMIGVIDLFDIAGGEAEIGYWLERAAWGQGIGREAATRIVRFGFEELGLTTIIAGCADDNAASAAILAGLGFTRLADARVFSNSRQEEITQRRYRLSL